MCCYTLRSQCKYIYCCFQLYLSIGILTDAGNSECGFTCHGSLVNVITTSIDPLVCHTFQGSSIICPCSWHFEMAFARCWQLWLWMYLPWLLAQCDNKQYWSFSLSHFPRIQYDWLLLLAFWNGICHMLVTLTLPWLLGQCDNNQDWSLRLSHFPRIQYELSLLLAFWNGIWQMLETLSMDLLALDPWSMW